MILEQTLSKLCSKFNNDLCNILEKSEQASADGKKTDESNQ
jgi:hypothetical protein